MSTQDIKNLTREELKTKSENLILLYEYLTRQDKKSSNANGARSKDNRIAKISDAELRDLVYSTQPSAINISAMFGCADTSSKFIFI